MERHRQNKGQSTQKSSFSVAFRRIASCTLLTLFVLPVLAPGARAQDGVGLLETAVSDIELLASYQSTRPTFFIGGALTNKRSSNNDSWDGSATFGVSFGDIDRVMNVRAAAVITSLTDDFGDSGYLSIRIARRENFYEIPVEAALTFGQLAGWGDAVGGDETLSASLSVAPVLHGRAGRQTPMRFTAGVKSKLNDFFSEPEYFVSTSAVFNDRMSASATLIDGSLNLGATVKFRDVLGPGNNFYVGLTLADALNYDSHRRVILRTGFSFPFGN